MDRTPTARAANAKDLLAFLEALRPGTTDHLRLTLPREVMDAVEGSARTDWNSLVLDGQYVTAVVAWLGPDEAREAWRQFCGLEFIRTPAIRAIFDGVKRLTGLSMSALVRVAPLAFQQGFRGFGDMRVHVAQAEATVEVRALAPEVLPNLDAYGVLFHGMFLGMYDLAGVRPQLDFRVEPDPPRMVARLRW